MITNKSKDSSISGPCSESECEACAHSQRQPPKREVRKLDEGQSGPLDEACHVTSVAFVLVKLVLVVQACVVGACLFVLTPYLVGPARLAMTLSKMWEFFVLFTPVLLFKTMKGRNKRFFVRSLCVLSPVTCSFAAERTTLFYSGYFTARVFARAAVDLAMQVARHYIHVRKAVRWKIAKIPGLCYFGVAPFLGFFPSLEAVAAHAEEDAWVIRGPVFHISEFWQPGAEKLSSFNDDVDLMCPCGMEPNNYIYDPVITQPSPIFQCTVTFMRFGETAFATERSAPPSGDEVEGLLVIKTSEDFDEPLITGSPDVVTISTHPDLLYDLVASGLFSLVITNGLGFNVRHLQLLQDLYSKRLKMSRHARSAANRRIAYLREYPAGESYWGLRPRRSPEEFLSCIVSVFCSCNFSPGDFVAEVDVCEGQCNICRLRQLSECHCDTRGYDLFDLDEGPSSGESREVPVYLLYVLQLADEDVHEKYALVVSDTVCAIYPTDSSRYINTMLASAVRMYPNLRHVVIESSHQKAKWQEKLASERHRVLTLGRDELFKGTVNLVAGHISCRDLARLVDLNTTQDGCDREIDACNAVIPGFWSQSQDVIIGDMALHCFVEHAVHGYCYTKLGWAQTLPIVNVIDKTRPQGHGYSAAWEVAGWFFHNDGAFPLIHITRAGDVDEATWSLWQEGRAFIGGKNRFRAEVSVESIPNSRFMLWVLAAGVVVITYFVKWSIQCALLQLAVAVGTFLVVTSVIDLAFDPREPFASIPGLCYLRVTTKFLGFYPRWGSVLDHIDKPLEEYCVIRSYCWHILPIRQARNGMPMDTWVRSLKPTRDSNGQDSHPLLIELNTADRMRIKAERVGAGFRVSIAAGLFYYGIAELTLEFLACRMRSRLSLIPGLCYLVHPTVPYLGFFPRLWQIKAACPGFDFSLLELDDRMCHYTGRHSNDLCEAEILRVYGHVSVGGKRNVCMRIALVLFAYFQTSAFLLHRGPGYCYTKLFLIPTSAFHGRWPRAGTVSPFISCRKKYTLTWIEGAFHVEDGGHLSCHVVRELLDEHPFWIIGGFYRDIGVTVDEMYANYGRRFFAPTDWHYNILIILGWMIAVRHLDLPTFSVVGLRWLYLHLTYGGKEFLFEWMPFGSRGDFDPVSRIAENLCRMGFPCTLHPFEPINVGTECLRRCEAGYGFSVLREMAKPFDDTNGYALVCRNASPSDDRHILYDLAPPGWARGQMIVAPPGLFGCGWLGNLLTEVYMAFVQPDIRVGAYDGCFPRMSKDCECYHYLPRREGSHAVIVFGSSTSRPAIASVIKQLVDNGIVERYQGKFRVCVGARLLVADALYHHSLGLGDFVEQDSDHDNWFLNFDKIFSHGGAGTIATSLAAGCHAVSLSKFLDRDINSLRPQNGLHRGQFFRAVVRKSGIWNTARTLRLVCTSGTMIESRQLIFYASWHWVFSPVLVCLAWKLVFRSTFMTVMFALVTFYDVSRFSAFVFVPLFLYCAFMKVTPSARWNSLGVTSRIVACKIGYVLTPLWTLIIFTSGPLSACFLALVHFAFDKYVPECVRNCFRWVSRLSPSDRENIQVVFSTVGQGLFKTIHADFQCGTKRMGLGPAGVNSSDVIVRVYTPREDHVLATILILDTGIPTCEWDRIAEIFQKVHVGKKYSPVDNCQTGVLKVVKEYISELQTNPVPATTIAVMFGMCGLAFTAISLSVFLTLTCQYFALRSRSSEEITTIAKTLACWALDTDIISDDDVVAATGALLFQPSRLGNTKEVYKTLLQSLYTDVVSWIPNQVPLLAPLVEYIDTVILKFKSSVSRGAAVVKIASSGVGCVADPFLDASERRKTAWAPSDKQLAVLKRKPAWVIHENPVFENEGFEAELEFRVRMLNRTTRLWHSKPIPDVEIRRRLKRDVEVPNYAEIFGPQAVENGVDGMVFACKETMCASLASYNIRKDDEIYPEGYAEELARAVVADDPLRFFNCQLSSPRTVLKEYLSKKKYNASFDLGILGVGKRKAIVTSGLAESVLALGVSPYVTGRWRPSMFGAFPKSQIVSRKKLIANPAKLRSITAATAADIVNQGVLYRDLNKRHNFNSFSKAGMPLNGTTLNKVFAKLDKFPWKYSCDLTAFDRNIPKALLDCVTRVRCIAFENHEQAEVIHKHIRCADEASRIGFIVNLVNIGLADLRKELLPKDQKIIDLVDDATWEAVKEEARKVTTEFPNVPGGVVLKLAGGATGDYNVTFTNSTACAAFILDMVSHVSGIPLKDLSNHLCLQNNSDDNNFSFSKELDCDAMKSFAKERYKMDLKVDFKSGPHDSDPNYPSAGHQFCGKILEPSSKYLDEFVSLGIPVPKYAVLHQLDRIDMTSAQHAMKDMNIEKMTTTAKANRLCARFVGQMENCAHRRDVYDKLAVLYNTWQRKKIRKYQKPPPSYETIMKRHYDPKYNERFCAQVDETMFRLKSEFEREREEDNIVARMDNISRQINSFRVSDLGVLMDCNKRVAYHTTGTFEPFIFFKGWERTGVMPSQVEFDSACRLSAFASLTAPASWYAQHAPLYMNFGVNAVKENVRIETVRMLLYTFVYYHMTGVLHKVRPVPGGKIFLRAMQAYRHDWPAVFSSLSHFSFLCNGIPSFAISKLMPKDVKYYYKRVAMDIVRMIHVPTFLKYIPVEVVMSAGNSACDLLANTVTFNEGPAIKLNDSIDETPWDLASAQIVRVLGATNTVLVTCPCGSGKTRYLPWKLAERMHVLCDPLSSAPLSRIVVVLPRTILCFEYERRNPGTIYKRRAVLTETRHMSCTYGYLAVGFSLSGALPWQDALYVFDESHEDSVEWEYLRFNVLSKVKSVLLTATAVPWQTVFPHVPVDVQAPFPVVSEDPCTPDLVAEFRARAKSCKRILLIHPYIKTGVSIAKKLRDEDNFEVSALSSANPVIPATGHVIATAIADASLTIPGCDCVIDSGLSVVSRGNGTELLPSTRATAVQRRGRTGRTCPGVYVTFTPPVPHSYGVFPSISAILRKDIIALSCKSLKGIEVLPNSDWPEDSRAFDYYGCFAVAAPLETRKQATLFSHLKLEAKDPFMAFLILRKDEDKLAFALRCFEWTSLPSWTSVERAGLFHPIYYYDVADVSRSLPFQALRSSNGYVIVS